MFDQESCLEEAGEVLDRFPFPILCRPNGKTKQQVYDHLIKREEPRRFGSSKRFVQNRNLQLMVKFEITTPVY